jgi:hypothetical protein
MRLAEQAGLHDAVTARVRLPGDKGANPAAEIAIDDLDIARHGGMRSLFTGVYAPSTAGLFLRAFTHGHVRQVQAAARDTQAFQIQAHVPIQQIANCGHRAALEATSTLDIDGVQRHAQ